MLTFTEAINTVNELFAGPIVDTYMPTLYELLWKRRTGGALMAAIPRSSEGVNNLKVDINFVTRQPWSWGAMSEFGFVPTGSKFAFASQEAQLGCHAANAVVSLHELVATEMSKWDGLINRQLKAVSETAPYYMRGVLYSSQNSKHAIGQVASISGTTVTLDNAGLLYTDSLQLCELIEDGMYLQAYRGAARVGDPFLVTAVSKSDGTIEISADPGLADNDVLTFSDIAGLDQRYSDLCPGIFDVIDDDNTFQGVDRSATAKDKYRANMATPASTFPTRTELRRWLKDCGDPAKVYCHYDFIEKYLDENIDPLKRYQPGATVHEGAEQLMIGKTMFIDDDDIPKTEIVAPDPTNWQIADLGGIQNLFGKGWQQVAGRPIMDYTFVMWMLLLAIDCRYKGRFNGFTL